MASKAKVGKINKYANKVFQPVIRFNLSKYLRLNQEGMCCELEEFVKSVKKNYNTLVAMSEIRVEIRFDILISWIVKLFIYHLNNSQ